MKQKIDTILSAILVIAWMIVIFCFSAMPADESNSQSMNIVNKAVEKFEAKSNLQINITDGQAVSIAETSNQTNNQINHQPTSRQATNLNTIIQPNQTANQEQARKEQKATLLLKLNKLFRKFAHASVYFILYILVLNLIYQIKGSYKFSYCITSIAVCFIYACTDEFHQLYVEGRTGLFSDVIIDTIGATISCIIVSIIHKVCTKICQLNNKKSTQKL